MKDYKVVGNKQNKTVELYVYGESSPYEIDTEEDDLATWLVHIKESKRWSDEDPNLLRKIKECWEEVTKNA